MKTKKEVTVNYDNDLLANLGRKVIGSRKIVEFCKEVNLSSSFVSRLINGKLPNQPTKNSLYKFVAVNPQNGITVDDMLIAAGYNLGNTNENGDKKTLKLSDKIFMRYSTSPTFGISEVINALVKKGIKQFLIDLEPEIFKIKIDSFPDLIVIPAYCNDSNAIESVEMFTTQKLFITLSSYKKENSIFFVLTNEEEIFDFLAQNYYVDYGVKSSVLLVKEQVRIEKQAILKEYGNENVENTFPIILI